MADPDQTERTRADQAAILGDVRGPSLRSSLVVIDGPSAGRSVVIREDDVTAGTATECDLRVEDDRVSRKHASVRAGSGGFLVVDLESTNGTFYEGSRISRAVVPAGAVLRIGRTSLLIRPEDSPDAIEPSPRGSFGRLVGQSVAMRRLFAILEQVSATDSTVLVEGETGTGKELVALAVHEASPRKDGPFIVLDCAAVPGELVESELFGHVRGAFTGAATNRPGAFVSADNGTLFLDELNSLPITMQPKLLRALESRSVKAVGSDAPRKVNVRVIAACNSDVERDVAEGRFRPDLFYRLSVVHVRIPPLRQRRDDIPVIAARMLEEMGGCEPGEISGPNLDRLAAHAWPGNVRELRNVIERACALSGGVPRPFRDMTLHLGPSREGGERLQVDTEATYSRAKEKVLASFERIYLEALMQRCGGNISLASRVSELDRKQLRKLLRRLGLIAGPETDEG